MTTTIHHSGALAMTVLFICHLRTPQDDRFSASGVVTLKYLVDESETVMRQDAKDIASDGHRAYETLRVEQIIAGDIPEGCYIPEGFPVTIVRDGVILEVVSGK
jgi:hypothetical protein